MPILILFAFLAGIVTILSPCILPILPVVLANSVTDLKSRHRPYGIVVGFVLSFTFFTLFLSTIVKQFGIPSDTLRNFSIIVIAVFGVSLLIPQFQQLLERLFSRLANMMPSSGSKTGFLGGIVVGLSIGLLWTPCVGPILASVIALALSGTITSDAIFITLAYSLGTAIPMYLVIIGGRNLFIKVPWLLNNTVRIQKIFGIIMILTALAIYRGYDRNFQTYILTKFPQYGSGLTKFEDQTKVQDGLSNLGKPTVSLSRPGNLAPSLHAGGQWFNTDHPLTLSELKGKVVLIDFWTYTCINCQRTLPYLKSWYDKYHDKGLVIIGVHSPEFEFEKDPKNVQKALTDFGIKYPVMQDNDFATWKSFNNHYWPAKYFIDKDGYIRSTHFGEGNYDESEATIQALLKETGAQVDEPMSNPEVPTYARTPETYLGSERSQGESYLSYSGKWTTTKEYKSPAIGAKLTLKFDAKDVYLVMKNTGSPATVKVFVDGTYSKDVIVNSDKLYTMVDLDSPGRHILELEFLDEGAELFAFTFG